MLHVAFSPIDFSSIINFLLSWNIENALVLFLLICHLIFTH